MAGACALRYAMEKEGLSGTVKLIEAPAEEIGQGKAYLAKDGVFDDVDMTLMWHPGPTDLDFSPVPQLVAFRAQFDFYGKTSHAALPWQGRSAVDAVQLMNLGCEFLREHMPQGALMHYCITDGGTAPNIVPEHGSSIYMFRVLDNYAETENLFQRAVKCAEGAAMMTDTRVEYKVLSVVPQYYYNLPLCEHVANAAKKIPVFSYAEEDYEMARSLYKNVTGQESPYPDEELLPIRVLPFREEKDGLLGCTDAADMTYYSPSLQIQGLGRIKDLPGGHHWTTSVISGCGIGWKPAVYGYKIIAQAAYDALKDPSIVQKCWDAYHAMNIPEHKDWL